MQLDKVRVDILAGEICENCQENELRKGDVMYFARGERLEHWCKHCGRRETDK